VVQCSVSVCECDLFDLYTPPTLAQTESPSFYYHFSPAPGWRVVVLDPLELSIIRKLSNPNREDMKDVAYRAALRILKEVICVHIGVCIYVFVCACVLLFLMYGRYSLVCVAQHNPNDCESFSGDWSKGVAGYNRRFVPYNGALTRTQLDWLDATLADCTAKKERVLIVSHISLHPRVSEQATLVWNYEDVMRVLHAHPDTVKACLYGHDHVGRYNRDTTGLHHLSFASPLECDPGQSEVAFALINVKADTLEVLAPGTNNKVPPRVLDLNF
jgi:3',5'-cyclic AMP phosphodiesterase CpdA